MSLVPDRSPPASLLMPPLRSFPSPTMPRRTPAWGRLRTRALTVHHETFHHLAIVLGLGQNGLATVRDLARQGIPVIGVDANLKQATAHTRLCRKVVCADFRGEGLLQCLLDLGRTLPAKGILFPSGDISLDLVSERR